MRRLAIIDDHVSFALSARHAFESAGYTVEWFGGTGDGIAAVTSRTFDLVLIRIEAGDSAALACRRLREEARTRHVPLIVVTSDPGLHSDALLSGADESILESATMRELVARAGAVLRRAAPAAEEPVAYEDDELKIFPDSMRVVIHGRQIPLSKGESDVLALLIRHAPASLSVERIRQELSESSRSISRSAIEARLKALRSKVGHDRIANRIGFGYSFQPRQVREHEYNRAT